jgi:DNA polymerase III epsilon subunit-like protein
MSQVKERFISVDVETSGPIPGEFSMLTIGACDAEDDDLSFSCSVQPLNQNADPKAMEVTGLSLVDLAKDGIPPEQAMVRFEQWLTSILNDGETAVLVGFNAPFDWSFINYYFHRFCGSNPFGFSALDIKAYYMGATGCDWADTRSSKLSERLHPTRKGNHQALDDAKYQAEIFRLVRKLTKQSD